MLGHRVVTLHPAVHGGILARRDIAGGHRRPRRARDRAVRPRRRQPLPVHRGRGRHGVTRGGGGRDDRHRRADAAARRGEELRARRAGRPAGAVRGDARGAAGARRAVARHAPLARGRGVRGHGRVRVGDRRLVRRPRGVPGGPDPDVLEGARPRVRREPAPARGLLRGGRRAPPPALARRAAQRARSSRTTTSTTSRPRGSSARSSRSRPA